MKLNSFTPIPENDEELQLPELVYCSSLGEIEQVKALLEQGIDPNQTDDEGYSALQAAAENDYLDIVKLLLSKGAKIHHKSPHKELELTEMDENKDIVAYFKSL